MDDEGNKKRKLLVFPNYEEREEIVARITENVENEKLGGGVWATPGLPLLIHYSRLNHHNSLRRNCLGSY